MQMPEILTLSDVAEVLRCSKPHVARLVRGEIHGVPALPAISLGRRKLVRGEALLRWITESERGGIVESSLEIGTGRRA